MPWSCDGCECGICDDPDCVCECRVMSSVTDIQLKELCIYYGLASSTSNHRRNTLFKYIYDTGDHINIFKEGVRRYVMNNCSITPLKKPTAMKRKTTQAKKLPAKKVHKKRQVKKRQTCDDDG